MYRIKAELIYPALPFVRLLTHTTPILSSHNKVDADVNGQERLRKIGDMCLKTIKLTARYEMKPGCERAGRP